MIIRNNFGGFFFCLALTSLVPEVASAEVVQAQGDDLIGQIEAVATGDQILVENRNETIDFAGHSIELRDFSGIIGFGSEIAYLATIDGETLIDGAAVRAGRILLVPPFGDRPSIERFDARRLHDAISSQADIAESPALASLLGLAKGQGRGVFLGRLGRTSFNVATLGSASAEKDRRERLGDQTVRSLRFANGESAAIEPQIVGKFIAALARGDASAAAQFLDPLPYGYDNLGDGGGAARLSMARAMLDDADWQALAQVDANPLENDLRWRVSSGDTHISIHLRRTQDFAFVQTVQVEK